MKPDKKESKFQKVVNWIKTRRAQMEEDYPMEYIEHNEYNFINFSGSFAFWTAIIFLFFGNAIFENWDKIIQLIQLLK